MSCGALAQEVLEHGSLTAFSDTGNQRGKLLLWAMGVLGQEPLADVSWM